MGGKRETMRARDGLVAGVDEAGRGPLAGPVLAAAVILDAERPIGGLRDSKALTPTRRERLEAEIRQRALAWSVGIASAAEVDRLNVLQATFAAMRRAVRCLSVAPDWCLVDGNKTIPRLGLPQSAIVDGDASEPCIAAASILAKVWRDRVMVLLDERYPGYGFARHKGYHCPQHIEALRRLGPCAEHRRSFAPMCGEQLVLALTDVVETGTRGA